MRHGEIDNPNSICYGRLTRFSLTEQERQQIEKTANFLLDKNITAIYSSPLHRTKQSAKIVSSKLKLTPVHFSNNLLEVKTSLEGKSLSYVISQNDVFPSKYNNIKGETIEDIAKRMQKFVRKITKIYNGENVVAVSHGDPIMIIKAFLEKQALAIESIRPGAEKYIKLGEIYIAHL